MKKQILYRSLIGFPIGICISIFITIIISLSSGQGEYIPVPPELISDIGTELNAFIFQLIISGLFGSIFAGSSVIWDTDWNLLKMTIVHFVIVTTISFPVAYMLRWMPRNMQGIIIFYCTFISIYLIIWVLLYLNIRRQIKKMNKTIQ